MSRSSGEQQADLKVTDDTRVSVPFSDVALSLEVWWAQGVWDQAGAKPPKARYTQCAADKGIFQAE